MLRSRLRSPALAAGSLVLCLAAVAESRGQGDLKSYRIEARQPPGDATTKMIKMRSNELFVTGAELKANQKLFRDVAQSIVNKVTYEQYYTTPDTGELRPRREESNMDALINELNSNLLIPTAESKFTLEQKAYINEFGAALDEALVAVLTKGGKPPSIILVNAGRMLAAASASGAPAHAKTVTALLTNTFFKIGGKPVETPPELLFYALKAAEALFAAYAPDAYLTPNPARHSLSDQDLEALIRPIESMVITLPPVIDKVAEAASDQPTRPGTIAPTTGPAGPAAVQGKIDARVLTPEQVAVVRYFRRQAVRALSKIRFDTVRDSRPAYAVAKIAVADLSIDPPPSAGEIADAVVGLAGIQPTPALNVDEWAATIGLGYDSLLRLRTGADDKSIPWRVYAARMQASLDGLKKTGASNSRAKPYQPALTGLANVVSADIVAAIGLPPDRAADAQPKLDGLYQWISQNVPKDASRSLYNDVAQYKLSPRAAQR